MIAKKILVVDDSPQVGEIVESLLRDLGHEPTFVLSAAAAIEALESRPGSFDMVLADIVMPEASGRDLAELITARWPNVRVVLTTGDAEDAPDDAPDDATLGIEILRKPFSVEALTSLVSADHAASGSYGPEGSPPPAGAS